jgi:4-hydroxy-4-methyl-2-oxoglutarate aldolase
MSTADPYLDFRNFSPTTLADVLPPGQALTASIRPLWPGMPRVAGAVYTVRCQVGDNLMLHAAIYRAPRGAVVVVEAPDTSVALAGGNVCAVALSRGIQGFVLDGMIRDIAEIRAIQFPVFARGVTPVAGAKNSIGELNSRVRCGGVSIEPGDAIVGDEEGIVVIPRSALEATLRAAARKVAKEADQSLGEWETEHRNRVDRILREKGFVE